MERQEPCPSLRAWSAAMEKMAAVLVSRVGRGKEEEEEEEEVGVEGSFSSGTASEEGRTAVVYGWGGGRMSSGIECAIYRHAPPPPPPFPLIHTRRQDAAKTQSIHTHSMCMQPTHPIPPTPIHAHPPTHLAAKECHRPCST